MASDVRLSYYCGASGFGADLAECRRAVTRGWGDAAWARCGRGAAEATLLQGSCSLRTTVGCLAGRRASGLSEEPNGQAIDSIGSIVDV